MPLAELGPGSFSDRGRNIKQASPAAGFETSQHRAQARRFPAARFGAQLDVGALVETPDRFEAQAHRSRRFLLEYGTAEARNDVLHSTQRRAGLGQDPARIVERCKVAHRGRGQSRARAENQECNEASQHLGPGRPTV